MKFHVMSDLHMEHYSSGSDRTEFWRKLDDKIALQSPDAVILAGDINNLQRHEFETCLSDFGKRYPRVYYVPGNHEFIHFGISQGHAKLRDIQSRISNLNVLFPGVVIHPNIPGAPTLGGGTLWYPDCGDAYLKREWFDYAYIPDAHREIQPQYELFVDNVLKNPPDIVVSHMLPTTESIADRWAGERTNQFFCADLDDLIEKIPKIWIHGHTHDPFDFKSRLGFRVFCNPRGYPREGLNPRFWDRLLLDTEDQGWYLKTFNGGSNDD